MKNKDNMNMNINDAENFSNNFIAKFLDNGFGAMTKRELEVYLLHLLLEDGQFKNGKGEIDYHEMSLALRISETKVRNLVYETELKYASDQDFVHRLIKVIEKGHYEVKGDDIKFAIPSALTKQYFEYEIRKLDGVSDGSFAKHIVTISRDTFEKLLINLYEDQNQINAIITDLPELYHNHVESGEGLIKLFVNEFVSGFSNQSGQRAAHMLFDTFDPAGLLRRVFGRE